MKKVFFSFLAIFCFFIAFNSCQAYTITSPHGVEYNINDEYQTYLAYAKDSNNEYILVSKKKGVFKLEWSSGWSDYAFVFYPEGSTSSSKFDYYYWGTKIAYDNSMISSGVAKNTCEISACNTTITFSKVNPNGNENVGDVFYTPTPDDPAIGDASSKLKLTYEYNEEFTECKINATLEGGAFTDKIYYSTSYSHLEGVLENKLEFPNSRYYNFRKCYCIFSSGR